MTQELEGTVERGNDAVEPVSEQQPDAHEPELAVEVNGVAVGAGDVQEAAKRAAEAVVQDAAERAVGAVDAALGGDPVVESGGQTALDTGDEPTITKVIDGPRPLKAELKLKAPKPIAVSRNYQPGEHLLLLTHASIGPVTTGGETRSHETVSVDTVLWEHDLDPGIAVNAVLDLETRHQRAQAVIDQAAQLAQEIVETEAPESGVDLAAAMRERLYERFSIDADVAVGTHGVPSELAGATSEPIGEGGERRSAEALRSHWRELQRLIAEAEDPARFGALVEEANQVRGRLWEEHGEEVDADPGPAGTAREHSALESTEARELEVGDRIRHPARDDGELVEVHDLAMPVGGPVRVILADGEAFEMAPDELVGALRHDADDDPEVSGE